MKAEKNNAHIKYAITFSINIFFYLSFILILVSREIKSILIFKKYFPLLKV